MPEYDNTNSGAIFRNKRKETDRHPDMTGTLNVEGREYWVSAWSKTSERVDGKFLSLSIKPKDEQQESKPTRSQQAYNKAALDDDEIPF